jgi:hypothetical protein
MTGRICLLYKEWECANEHLNPGAGEGSCSGVTEMKKGEQFPTCRKCAEVLQENKCPRGKRSPYLKQGERA